MTASNRQFVAVPCSHILQSCRYRGPSTPVATATCAQDDRTREAALVGAPSKIIHHGDTEDTESWFPQSFLRDLRASVVNLHPYVWAAWPCDTQDDNSEF